MLKLSLDNPFLLSLAIIFFGLLGYVYSIQDFREFDYLFIVMMLFLFFFLFFLAEYIERKNFPGEISVNISFCYLVVLAKLFFLVFMINSGPAESFDDRLSVFGGSFFLGINNALSIFLFPLIPALTRKRHVFWACVLLWVAGSLVTLLYAPSKSFVISLVFSLLLYRFIKRKIFGGKSRIPIFSIRSIAIVIFVAFTTALLIYSRNGSEAIDVLLHRAAYNYDIAIYISSIYGEAKPDHGVLFYAILPLLKQFDAGLYDLKFYSMPQWVVYEALGIERYGRFGYPNDNLAAGLLVSYGVAGIFCFIFSFFVWGLYVCFALGKRRVSLFFVYLVLQIPLFYSSLQDFSIYFFVVFFLYMSFSSSSSVLRFVFPRVGVSA